MIVRILHEGQFEVEDDQMETLETMDGALLREVEGGHREAYRARLKEILDLIRQGRRLDHDELRSSDLVVPAADFSLEEARDLLEPHGGEGKK